MEHCIFLKACRSEVATMNMFIKGETAFIPDLLLIFFYISVFLLDHVVDRIFIVYILLYNEEKILILLFIVSVLAPLVPLFMQLNYQQISTNSYFRCYILPVVLAVFGLDSIYLGVEALKGITEFKETLNMPKTNSFIHIAEEKLFIFKTYCYLSIFIKTIPQLMWMPILIIESNLTEFELIYCIQFLSSAKGTMQYGDSLALTSIMANILILSLTIAVTFPIPKSRRIYSTCIPLLVNSFSKFMATICACCIHLIVFTVVYRYMRFKVLIVLLPKFLIWLYPSYHNLNHQGRYLSNLEVFVHGLCLALISTFIYIHPFHGTGTFFYYSFNLLSFLVEMISINAFSETNGELTITYLTLRVLIHGYVACFRVVDSLFMLRYESAESQKASVQAPEKMTSQGELSEMKDESKGSISFKVNETENGDDNLEVRQPSNDPHQNERDN